MTLTSEIFSQLLDKTMIGQTSKVQLVSNKLNQCNSRIIWGGISKCLVKRKINKQTQLQMYWACIMNIHILLQRLTNTMLSTLWQASEVSRSKWSSSKRSGKCNKCKWCNYNSNNNSSKCNSPTLVALLLSSSIAKCNSSKWICSSNNTEEERSTCNHNTKTKWCNSNNSHSGKHSSSPLIRTQELSSQIQEASVTLAHSNPPRKTTIKLLPANTTVD